MPNEDDDSARDVSAEDGALSVAADEEENTAVIVPPEFIARSIERVCKGLDAAAGSGRRVAQMVRAGRGAIALEELDESWVELVNIIVGAIGGHGRLTQNAKGEFVWERKT